MLTTGFALKQLLLLTVLTGIFSVQVEVHLRWRLKLIVMISLNIHIMISPVLVWSFALFPAVICPAWVLSTTE